MSLKLSIITVLNILFMENFRKLYICLADPVPPLDPGCHFDMMCICEKHIYCQKDMLGLGGNVPRNKL